MPMTPRRAIPGSEQALPECDQRERSIVRNAINTMRDAVHRSTEITRTAQPTSPPTLMSDPRASAKKPAI